MMNNITLFNFLQTFLFDKEMIRESEMILGQRYLWIQWKREQTRFN